MKRNRRIAINLGTLVAAYLGFALIICMVLFGCKLYRGGSNKYSQNAGITAVETINRMPYESGSVFMV